MIIDTHIHLDDDRYKDDLDEALERARKNGVERFIIPGADAKTLDRAIEISEANDDVYFAVGIHPYDMDGFESLDFDMYAKHNQSAYLRKSFPLFDIIFTTKSYNVKELSGIGAKNVIFFDTK